MKAKAVEVKTHSKLSSSGSERWLNCAASVALEEKAPPQEESEYAAEGTEAHSCFEMILKNYPKGKPYIAAKMLRDTYPDEMVDHALKAFEYVVSCAPKGAEILCETKSDLSHIDPDLGGTFDAAIIELFGTLWVFDYKYGAGVPVDPEDNTQMISYALGIAHKYDYNFVDVKMVIIQPRAEHERGPIRTCTMSMEELMGWTKKFKIGAEKTKDPFATFNPNPKWCRWCKAKTICPAISEQSMQEAQIDFDTETGVVETVPIANMIKPEKLSNLLTGIARLKTWIEAVEAHALFVAKKGVQIPGFKLVKKRSTRKWVDEEKTAKEAKKLWGPFAFSKPELLSPAQLEKSVGDAIKFDKKWIAKRVVSESAGETLVTEDDPRPPYNMIEADFSEMVVDQNVKITKIAKTTKVSKISKTKRRK